MAGDPVNDYLKSFNTSDRVRDVAWEAVYSAREGKIDADELNRRLKSLPFSDDVRDALWAMGHGEAPPATQQAQQPAAPQQQPSATSRFFSNAGEMLNPVTAVKGAANAVMHPWDTTKALYNAQAGQFSQAADAFKEGGLEGVSRAVGHTAAGLLPVLGPIAADAGEQMRSGDVAGGMGKAVGLLAPFGVKPALRVARAVVPNKAGVAAALEKGAATRVADVMSPKVGRNKIRIGNQAEQVAPQMAKDLATDGAPLTREGFQSQVGTRLAAAEQKLDAASDARLNGRAFETKPIIDDLLEKRRQLTAEAVKADRPMPEYQGQGARVARPDTEFAASGSVRTEDVPTHSRGYRTTDEQPGRFTEEPRRAGVPLGKDVVPHHNSARVAEIDAAIKEVQNLGPVARYEDIRKIRMSYDPAAKVKYAPSVTDDFLAKSGQSSGAADVTGVLRDHLAKWDPQTAAANADYHIYRTADDALEAVRQVERSRPRVGRQIMARLTGTLFGGQQAGVPGAVAGYVGAPLVDQMLASGITTKLKTARLMQNLADAIRSGDVSRVNGITALIEKEMRAAQAGAVTAPPQGNREPLPATP